MPPGIQPCGVDDSKAPAVEQERPDRAAATSTRDGDSLWAFTRRRVDGLYVLAAELIVRSGSDVIAVLDAGKFVGLLTSPALLAAAVGAPRIS